MVRITVYAVALHSDNWKGHFDAQGLDGNDLRSMDDGKLKILSDPHYQVHVHASKHD